MADLSFCDVMRITLASTVGAAILFAPRILTGAAVAPHTALCVILAAGALALVQALCYAELARLVPGGGGDATYMKIAFGPAPAAAYNLLSCFAVIPAACAFCLAQTAAALHMETPAARCLLVLATLGVLLLPARHKHRLFRVLFCLKVAVAAVLAALIGYSWRLADGGCLRSPPATCGGWGATLQAFVNCTFFFSGYNTCNYLQCSASFAAPYAVSVAISTGVYFLFTLGQFATFSTHQLTRCDTLLLLAEAPLSRLLSPPALARAAACVKTSMECVLYLGPVLSCHAVFDGISAEHLAKHRVAGRLVYVAYGLTVYLFVHFGSAASILNGTAVLISLFYCATFVALLRLRHRVKDPLNVLVPLAALLASGATTSVDVYCSVRALLARP